MGQAENRRPAVEPVLLTVCCIKTLCDGKMLTNASGFYFKRDSKLFLITSRHVLYDEATGHFPDQIEIDVHVDASNVALIETVSLPLYRDGASNWKEAIDSAGPVDVAAIEIDRDALPVGTTLRAFREDHLADPEDYRLGVGTPVLIVGFPLGFHDTFHHLPVARHAIIASSYGLRFQGEGFFLTDGRTHRGTSGAPIVAKRLGGRDNVHDLTWTLAGVHSASFEIGRRDRAIDEALGLNCGWYADVISILTE